MQLFRRTRCRDNAISLYDIIVTQSRKPEFYVHCGVPDTVDGRFDLIVLHAFIVLRRLKTSHHDTAQALLEVIFDDMDRNLREMGAGDMGISRRVKLMAKALYGRIRVYEEALDGDETMLAKTLRRNLYGTVVPTLECIEEMEIYVRTEAMSVAYQSIEKIASGILTFGAPPSGRL